MKYIYIYIRKWHVKCSWRLLFVYSLFSQSSLYSHLSLFHSLTLLLSLSLSFTVYRQKSKDGWGSFHLHEIVRSVRVGFILCVRLHMSMCVCVLWESVCVYECCVCVWQTAPWSRTDSRFRCPNGDGKWRSPHITHERSRAHHFPPCVVNERNVDPFQAGRCFFESILNCLYIYIYTALSYKRTKYLYIYYYYPMQHIR